MAAKPGDITILLGKVKQGDKSAEAILLDLVYRELKAIASRYMKRERRDHTLEPTALVHEAYLKLAGEQGADWQDRAHFFAVASKTMRRILIDHARAHLAAKRGGGQRPVEIEQLLSARRLTPETVLAISEALDELSKFDPRQASVVEMRFFGGLSDEEAAKVLAVSARTIKRDWATAKAWLYSHLN